MGRRLTLKERSRRGIDTAVDIIEMADGDPKLPKMVRTLFRKVDSCGVDWCPVVGNVDMVYAQGVRDDLYLLLLDHISRGEKGLPFETEPIEMIPVFGDEEYRWKIVPEGQVGLAACIRYLIDMAQYADVSYCDMCWRPLFKDHGRTRFCSVKCKNRHNYLLKAGKV